MNPWSPLGKCSHYRRTKKNWVTCILSSSFPYALCTAAGLEALNESIDQISGTKQRLKKDKKKGKEETTKPVDEDQNKMENTESHYTILKMR